MMKFSRSIRNFERTILKIIYQKVEKLRISNLLPFPHYTEDDILLKNYINIETIF